MTTNRPTPAAAADLDEARVREILRQVIDPEVGRDIVSLGLVYRVDISADRLVIEMTMTSPACPMGDMIIDDAYAVLAGHLPAQCTPKIVLVWSPPWDPSMMSPKSRENLGW